VLLGGKVGPTANQGRVVHGGECAPIVACAIQWHLMGVVWLLIMNQMGLPGWLQQQR
jgi:heme/copper-type cytochrome/quinol oxidase subunit 3